MEVIGQVSVWDGVGNDVKGCTEAQKDEYSNEARDELVVCYFEEGGLGAVARAEARLQGFIELKVEHMLVKLFNDCSCMDFAEERKVGDLWLE